MRAVSPINMQAQIECPTLPVELGTYRAMEPVLRDLLLNSIPFVYVDIGFVWNSGNFKKVISENAKFFAR